MARRFRRRPRVVWFRPTGTPQDGIQTALENPGAIILDNTTITIGNAHTPVIEIPLVTDQNPEEVFATAPLSVFQQSGLNQTIEYGYRLRRVVGTIQLTAVSDSLGQGLPPMSAVLVTAGIIVRRVDATGVSPLTSGDTHPGLIGQFSDPWIWRRAWVLSILENPVLTATVFNETTRAAFSRFPVATTGFGDVRSGPHVDAKTARRIGPEERLFLNIGFTGIPVVIGTPAEDTISVRGAIDLRVLGSLSMNSGNRRNASR